MTAFTDIITEKYGYVILAYLLVHGETKQNDFYGMIGRNHQLILKKLEFLEGYGLVTDRMMRCEGTHHMARYWTLTPKGKDLSEHLTAAEKILDGDFDLETNSMEEVPKEH